MMREGGYGSGPFKRRREEEIDFKVETRDSGGGGGEGSVIFTKTVSLRSAKVSWRAGVQLHTKSWAFIIARAQ